MYHTNTFWILGGDLRSHWLAKQWSEEGKNVHCYGLAPQFLPNSISFHSSLDTLPHRESAVAVLPLPLCREEGFLVAPFAPQKIPLEDVFSALSPSQLIFGGQINPSVLSLGDKYKLTLRDYYAREELAIANAVPTAEGCLQIAMERLPITIQDGNFLVLGYGKVATATANRFSALGATVTICARSVTQLEQARADGFATVKLSQVLGTMKGYHCLINTIPALLFGKAQLEDMEENAIFIDLASVSGVDMTEAMALSRTIIPALSLPGKVAPATASLAIKRTLMQMLDEVKDGDFS